MKKMRAEKALIFFQTFFKKLLTNSPRCGIIIMSRGSGKPLEVVNKFFILWFAR
mgnify:CR=1 FL=1